MSLLSAPLRPALAARAARRVACALSALLLYGCASMPGPGEVVTVAVQGPITARDLTNRRDVAAARPALQAAGIGAAEIDAGRVVRVQCALMSDGWWDSLALLPEGLNPTDGRVLTLVVSDQGSNDRLAVNRIVAQAQPPLGPGGRAYRAIPDWRERGLRQNFEEQPPAGGPRSDYLIVQGAWLVRCRR